MKTVKYSVLWIEEKNAFSDIHDCCLGIEVSLSNVPEKSAWSHQVNWFMINIHPHPSTPNTLVSWRHQHAIYHWKTKTIWKYIPSFGIVVKAPSVDSNHLHSYTTSSYSFNTWFHTPSSNVTTLYVPPFSVIEIPPPFFFYITSSFNILSKQRW